MSTKVKTRFTTLDVTAMVTELRSKLTGMRINNIYDLNLKTYVFKLGKSEQKDFLVLESGVRFHTTSVSSEKNKIPTPFTMKLRKYLRDKRLENIQQVGVERVVDFTFGRDENETHIILELYASGNLILTDSQYRILALLRSHEFTEEVKTAVGEVYPFEHAANLKLESFRTDKEYIEQLINQEPSGGKEEEAKIAEKKVPEEPQKDNKTKKNQKQKGQENKENKDAKNKEKAKKNVRKLKDILFLLLPCLHQALVDQILRDKNLNPNTKAGEEHITPLQEIANETIEFLKAFPTKKQVGYLSYKETKPEEDQPVGTMNGKENVEPKQNEPEGEAKGGDKSAVGSQSFVKYLEFSPIPLKSGDPVKEIDSFDKSVDEFFTKQQVPDAQKGENDKKRIAWRKFENIKNDQDTRMRKLKAEQDECLTKAVLIEHNLKEVDVIINIVGAMVQGGLGWDKIWKMISESKNGGDPFASMITRLKLENDQAVILLKNPDEPQLEAKEVEVDIRVKAFINAERYYQEKKKLEIKEKKTLEASQQALKLAEKAAMAEINHEKQKSHVLITRKTYWFEKFSWFITSENYLVIGGRDAQQNEMLVKKYLKKGDLYMHADIHGAGSVVIKNPSNKPVPKITLEEAAIFTVCRSKAWESKIITSAWWVYDHQVSKTAQSGEYLPTGSFMVRGKKNFLNPSRLEMGFGLLFKIDESSLPRHENDRKVKFEEGEEEAAAAELPAPEQVQEPEQYFITGQERPIIKTYEKPKQQGGKQQKDLTKEKSFVQEEKKSAFNDDDDDEDEFKGLRRGSENKGIQKKGSITETDKNLKNLPAQKVPRGKKAKIQKMKEKYGDQDEDEKEMRLKLTGAKEIKELRDESSDDDRKNKKKDKGKDKDKGKQKGGKQGGDQKPKQQNQGQKGPQHSQGQPQKPKPEAKPQGGERVQPVKPETEVQGEVKKVTEKLPTETKPEEPKKVAIEEPKKEASEEEQEKSSQEEVEETKENELSDAVNSKGDIEGSQVNEEVKEEDLEKEAGEGGPQEALNEGDELRLLISNPHPDDVILFCVPVCGPYATLSNYKYKSKLVPGTLKKGKAVKTVMSVFLAPKDLPENEKKLMKNLGDTELVNAMIGNVKVGAAGLLKIKEKEKKAKEQKKKEYRSQEKKNVDKK